MTADRDARQEAEQIVVMVENELAHRIAGVQDADAYRDRLVDVLAAAIRLLEAEDAMQRAADAGIWKDSEAEDRWQEAYGDLCEALWALRESGG